MDKLEIPVGDEQLPSKEEKHFYRTIFKIEVLSDELVGELDLEQINYAITDGHCSGDITIESQLEISPKQMAELLIAQGSDPEFLGLDNQGNETNAYDDSM